MKKILISRAFGAGWSTIHYNKQAKLFKLTYKPIIEFLEKNPKIDLMNSDEYLDIMKVFQEEFREKFNENPQAEGCYDLVIVEVEEFIPFYINAYDGIESVKVFNEDDWMVLGGGE